VKCTKIRVIDNFWTMEAQGGERRVKRKDGMAEKG